MKIRVVGCAQVQSKDMIPALLHQNERLRDAAQVLYRSEEPWIWEAWPSDFCVDYPKTTSKPLEDCQHLEVILAFATKMYRQYNNRLIWLEEMEGRLTQAEIFLRNVPEYQRFAAGEPSVPVTEELHEIHVPSMSADKDCMAKARELRSVMSEDEF